MAAAVTATMTVTATMSIITSTAVIAVTEGDERSAVIIGVIAVIGIGVSVRGRGRDVNGGVRPSGLGLSVNGCNLGVIGRDGGIRDLEHIGNGRGLSGGRVFGGDNFALFDHGVDDTIGNALVSKINDVLWTQGVDRPSITDVIDDNIVANLAAAKFEDVFDAVRELGRGESGLGGGISGCRDGDWRDGGS